LAAFLPPDVAAWDDASNNKWLISGRGALIMNPPSVWAVAKRDAPQVAQQLWTHGFAAGPKGRFVAYQPIFLPIWAFSKNKEAAKSLLVHLSQPSSIEKLVVASGSYDLPPYEKLTTLQVWAEAEPPKGTLYHYPNPYNHLSWRLRAGRPRRRSRGKSTRRRANGENARLGGRRVRRLFAELKTRDRAESVHLTGFEIVNVRTASRV
jgi:hypothetical protein